MRRSKLLLFVGLLFLSVSAEARQNRGSHQYLVNSHELASSMDHFLVLHVAISEADFTSGHIPGARFLDLNLIAPSSEVSQRDLPNASVLETAFEQVGVSDHSQVLLYDTGNGLSAARAFFTLDYLGFENVTLLDGGFASWKEASMEIETGPRENGASGNLTVNLRPDRVRSASETRRDANTHVLIDARSEGEYSGATPGSTITRGGHIPGALWLDSSSHLREDGQFKPLEQLVDMYKKAGDKPVIVYCRTGMKASQSYFVARMLGLDVALYDGSFYDWSNHTDYEVATGDN